MQNRLIPIVALLAAVPLLSSCSHINQGIGNILADHLPQWAGGEPKGVPPRPGAPGYEEFRNRLNRPAEAQPNAETNSDSKTEGEPAETRSPSAKP